MRDRKEGEGKLQLKTLLHFYTPLSLFMFCNGTKTCKEHIALSGENLHFVSGAQQSVWYWKY